MGPVAGNVSHNRNLATANLLAISNLALSAMQRRMSGKIMKALSRVQLSPLGPYDAFEVWKSVRTSPSGSRVRRLGLSNLSAGQVPIVFGE
jgi:hypothetical protein